MSSRYMIKFFTKIYKKIKSYRLFIKIALLVIGLFVFLVIITFPITNGNFNAKFYNLTKDEGYDAIKLINLEKRNTVTKAKAALKEKISELEALEPPRSLIEMTFNYTAGTEYEKKNDYISTYKKFYASPYWEYWEDSEPLWVQYEEKQKLLEEKNKLYSKERYVTAKSEKMLDEIMILNKDIELLNERITENSKMAEEEYALFTKHLGKLYEKFY